MGKKYLVTETIPKKLTSKTFLKSSTESISKGATVPGMPALLTIPHKAEKKKS